MGTEKSHDGVADVFINNPIFFENDRSERLEDIVEQGTNLIGLVEF